MSAIRTPDAKLRVFVSSTLVELADERRAAREAIEQIRLAPVMFEMGARPHPPRALYRAYLEQSDVFIGIYWQRYGWVAPDMDISGLEDEFRLSERMTRLIYIKEPAPRRDEGLTRLIDALESEGSTASYKVFADADELRAAIADDLALMLTERFVDEEQSVEAVPQPTTPLLGRDVDVRDVVRLLLDENRRLVTLTGVGGIGKTRVAIAVVEATRHRWPDGAVFVDLSGLREPAAVIDVVAAACGAVAQGTEATIDALTRRIGGRKMLLVLDNFEQVVDAGPAIADLLQRCADVHALVTSRVVLRVRGEREFPVAPLGRDPAVDLFVQRAQDVRPSFQRSADVAELCRRLDGVPLAIELAAARMRLLSPRQVLDRLHDRTGAAFADLPERQRTLEATLDWSYDLLDSNARTFFNRLSVFSGAFTLEDAEAVCTSGDVDFGERLDVVDELSTLVDHSLVSVAARADGEPAFRMLETVRAYAAAKLRESGETDAIVERLYQHLVTLLETIASRLASAEQADAFLRLEGEVENILTAMGWAMTTGRPFTDLLYMIAVSTWLFWVARGQYRRFPPNLLELVQASPLAPDLTDLEWTVVRFAAAGPAFSSGRFEEVIELLRDQAAIAEAAGQTTEAAVMLMALAASRPYEPGGPAREEFERARELVNDEMNRGYVLVHMGSLLLADGDVAGARELQEESLRIAARLGDSNLRAESHFQLAHDAVVEGNLDEARGHAAAAAQHYLAADHLEGQSFTLGALAGIAASSGDGVLGARLLGAAAALRDPIRLRPWPLVGEIERRYADTARGAVGAERYRSEYETGRRLSVRDAIELGLAMAKTASA